MKVSKVFSPLKFQKFFVNLDYLVSREEFLLELQVIDRANSHWRDYSWTFRDRLKQQDEMGSSISFQSLMTFLVGLPYTLSVKNSKSLRLSIIMQRVPKNSLVRNLRSDNGSEFKNKYFKRYCSKSGIKQEFTNVHSPEQDGVCEHFNQTTHSYLKSILSDSSLSHKFWPDTVLYFSYT